MPKKNGLGWKPAFTFPGLGGGIDIHKAIGKLPRPKSGFTPSKYKYMGPYNPLDKQLKQDKDTGEVLDWYVQPYNKVDEIAVMTWETVTNKWLNHWIRFLMVKCQNGVKQNENLDLVFQKKLKKPSGEEMSW